VELATGAVRYEFSGPGEHGWYAAFLPDASGFLASQLFDRSVALWPTARTAERDRAPPKSKPVIEGVAGSPLGAEVSATGVVALALHDGEVRLHRFQGDAPKLAPPVGEGSSSATFTPSGRHVVALRGGKVSVWPVPEPAKAAPATEPR
jgi:hypothetical protein